jgi:ketosteroid isomerase-like protein
MHTDQLLDRLAITDVTIEYCWALDQNDFERLRNVFLPDAIFDIAGTPHHGLDAIMARVSAALTPLDDSQHLISNHQIVIDGDRATSRCYLQAQHVRKAAEGGPNFIFAGRYEDELVRTPEGWRISHRTLAPMWTEGNPAVTRPPR